MQLKQGSIVNHFGKALSGILMAACFGLLLGGCRPNDTAIYSEHYTVPNAQWKYDWQPRFQFEIKDTNAAYQPSFIIRHTNSYPFNNIWLKLMIKAPGEKDYVAQRLEIKLAAPIAITGEGEQTGGWTGRGMGELWEQRKDFTFTNGTPQAAISEISVSKMGGDGVTSYLPRTRFHRTGVYEIKLQQDMRISPLPEVIQVGMQLQKMEELDKRIHQVK